MHFVLWSQIMWANVKLPTGVCYGVRDVSQSVITWLWRLVHTWRNISTTVIRSDMECRWMDRKEN